MNAHGCGRPVPNVCEACSAHVTTVCLYDGQDGIIRVCRRCCAYCRMERSA